MKKKNRGIQLNSHGNELEILYNRCQIKAAFLQRLKEIKVWPVVEAARLLHDSSSVVFSGWSLLKSRGAAAAAAAAAAQDAQLWERERLGPGLLRPHRGTPSSSSSASQTWATPFKIKAHQVTLVGFNIHLIMFYSQQKYQIWLWCWAIKWILSFIPRE